MNSTIFNDAVHGNMSFSPLITKMINTKQIQRLKNIKQLGMCYYVYPAASHNRFEHSLGTAFLAGRFFDKLLEQKIYGLKIDETKTKLIVQIAALCHDVGHGPFSHTWEKFLERVAPERKWKHEHESVRIFDSILKEKTVDLNFRSVTFQDLLKKEYNFEEQDIQNIKKLILGDNSSEKFWCQIVNNQECDIDVDKWDYLMRDSLMLNVPIGFDHRRLMDFSFTAGSLACITYRDKITDDIMDMFLARQKLHEVAYQHPTVIIIEEMLIDALELANDRLKLSTTPIEELTDHIYYKILYEGDENMRKARQILERIERRNLYKCIASCTYEGTPPSVLKIMAGLAQVPDFSSISNYVGICHTKNLWCRNGVLFHSVTKNHNAICKNEHIIKKAEQYIKQSDKLSKVFLLYKDNYPINYELKNAVTKKFYELCAKK